MLRRCRENSEKKYIKYGGTRMREFAGVDFEREGFVVA